jgi:thioredoxin-related protein
MTMIRRAALGAATILFLATTASAGTWLTSYEEAAKQAKKDNKLILADFTGSDWCGWCMKLKREVFDTPQFAEWAGRNVILLELDFPKNKKLPAETEKQNQELAAKYKIQGYPTILLLDDAGNVAGQTGYVAGGPVAWINEAQGLIAAFAGLKPETKLAMALQRARQSNGPVLVLLGGADVKEETLKPFYRSPELATLVEAGVVLARVQTVAGEGTSADEAKTAADLATRVGIKGPELHCLLLDSTGQKVLHDAAGNPEAKTLIPAICKTLPAMTYNGEWLESYAKALIIAAQKDRAMLLDFTGSDWCGWCMKLDKEVLSTPDFTTYAKEKLVLVKLDFPRQKQLPANVVSQNKALMRRHGVRGFPTLIVADAAGQPLGTLGYMEGGPKTFLAKLGEFVK